MKTIERDGTTYVLVPKEAWDKLARGQVTMPELPAADEDGNRDAIAFARASIARTLIRDRVAAGLSQAELARRAGMARESLNRIERAKVTPDEKTVARLENAIKKAMTQSRVRGVPGLRRKGGR